MHLTIFSSLLCLIHIRAVKRKHISRYRCLTHMHTQHLERERERTRAVTVFVSLLQLPIISKKKPSVPPLSLSDQRQKPPSQSEKQQHSLWILWPGADTCSDSRPPLSISLFKPTLTHKHTHTHTSALLHLAALSFSPLSSPPLPHHTNFHPHVTLPLSFLCFLSFFKRKKQMLP